MQYFSDISFNLKREMLVLFSIFRYYLWFLFIPHFARDVGWNRLGCCLIVLSFLVWISRAAGAFACFHFHVCVSSSRSSSSYNPKICLCLLPLALWQLGWASACLVTLNQISGRIWKDGTDMQEAKTAADWGRAPFTGSIILYHS